MRPDIKARREKYGVAPTKAQTLFGDSDSEILNERPFGMDIALYKQMRSYQSKVIKGLTKGRPNERVASLMRKSTPSAHLQEMVLKARIKKYVKELESMPKEKQRSVTIIDKVFNFFRNITSWETRQNLSLI